MVIELLYIFAILCTTFVCGKLIAKIKLPAILGWLIAGIVFGPFLAGIVSLEITNSLWYNVFIKFFECFAGVMIGREIIFKKIASSGKQIIGITFVQSIGTFLFVSVVFGIVFFITELPLYLALIFGGIALATAPALSIVNEYHTSGPVTKTLIPLAAIDDIIGVVVFFTVISIVNGIDGNASDSLFAIVGMILLPFAIGIFVGMLTSFLIKRSRNNVQSLLLLVASLCTSAVCGLLIDNYVFHAFRLNYLLIGMAFSATIANLIPEQKLAEMLKLYDPVLNLSLILVIVNLGMPLDYRLIAGAGLFTVIYIFSRGIGKIGVSLVFTGIAVSTLTVVDASLAPIVSGIIVAAAIINEIIAVIVAKFAFQWAGEIEG